MPLFEYQCSDCGHVTEFLETADNTGAHACESCGGTHVDKLLPTFGIVSGGSNEPPPCSSCCADGACPYN